MKAYGKDIVRSILKSKKRFFAVALITMLGVTVFTGIYAAVQDMYRSADRFYDEQGLFDIRIQSTLGLTQEDVAALLNLSFVEDAQGGYSEKVYTEVNGNRKSAEMTVLSAKRLNMPYVLEGALPSGAGEIAVTQAYVDASGKGIGDTVTIQEDMEDTQDLAAEPTPGPDAAEPGEPDDGAPDTDVNWDAEIEVEQEEERPTFSHTAYTITGVVQDTLNISDSKTASFRSVKTADYPFFVTPESADYDVYTVVYLRLAGLGELDSFSGAYEKAVQRAVDAIEAEIKESRERYRYDHVMSEALEKITDAQAVMDEKFAEADAQFSDAWQEIADAKKELSDGEAELTKEERDALKKLADARVKLEEARGELVNGQAELEVNAQKLADGRAELEAGKKEFAQESALAEIKFADAEKQLFTAQAELDEGLKTLEAQLAPLKSAYGAAWPEEAWNAYVAKVAELTVSGADDVAILSGSAAERAALLSAASDALSGMMAQLQLQIAQTQGGLDAANARISAIDAVDLPAAAQACAEAQAALEREQTILDAMNGDEVNYAAQEQNVQTAREALEAANGAIAALHAQREGNAGAARQYAAALEQMRGALIQLPALPAQTVEAATGLGKIRGGQTLLAENTALLEAGRQQLKDAAATIAQGEASLTDGERKLAEARQELLDGWEELARGEAELKRNEKKALRELADAWDELADGKQELADGETELTENEQTYHEKQQEARQKIVDAYEELRDIDMTEWYVQDRSSLSSYSGMIIDLDSIKAIGTAFPIIFLVVAVLISLTTMSRMVEEDRGLIGTYKALGFSDRWIYRKYILYAVLACLLGGALGYFFGFVVLPLILFTILRVLYLLPNYTLYFDFLYGTGSVLLFALSIVGATVLACRTELRRTPASLMRPKSPRAGSRVLLERIPLLWNRLRFLSKVTMRNLFRYRKRLFMTVIGIMGCTSLILAGFAIKDSVAALLPKQYGFIYQYDMMATADRKDNDQLMELMENGGGVADYISLQIGSVKVINAEGESESMQLMVIPEDGSLAGYINLVNRDGVQTAPSGTGILLTRNAAELLALKAGDKVQLQNLLLDKRETSVDDVLENYLGNTVYMTQGLYESLFGAYEPNGVLAHLSDSSGDAVAFSDRLLERDFITSSVSVAAIKNDFAENFYLINTVVYVLLLLAAGLAFVVLFTLSNTNISERSRELATIKVLGFFDREVHAYVNKETLILTALGILAGLPVGRVVSAFLLAALKMPSIYFAVSIEGISYVLAAVISFCFAWIVNLMTNRSLDRIDMVEALKSVE